MIWFFDPRTSSPLFADDVSFWSTDQQLTAVDMVLSWDKVDWLVQVRREEFEYVRVLLMSEGRMEWEINPWIERFCL